MLCVLGGALVCTPKRTYWLYVNGDDICCAYGFQLVCSARRECLAWRFKARMSGVAFCAEEVIVDVLRLSVVFYRRYFIYLLGLRQ